MIQYPTHDDRHVDGGDHVVQAALGHGLLEEPGLADAIRDGPVHVVPHDVVLALDLSGKQ